MADAVRRYDESEFDAFMNPSPRTMIRLLNRRLRLQPWGIHGLGWLLVLASVVADDKPHIESARVATPDELPLVDTNRVDTAVAEQLQQVAGDVRRLLAQPGVEPAVVASAFGEYGRVLHACEYHSAAISCYQSAITRAPSEPRWHHLLGCAAESDGQFDLAVRALRRSLELAPRHSATAVHLGHVHLRRNELEEARKIFTTLLTLPDNLPSAQAGLGAIALAERRYPAAIEHFTAVLQAVPDADQFHYSLGMAHRGAGDVEQARVHLSRRGSRGLKPRDEWLDDLPNLLRSEHSIMLRARLAYNAGAMGDAIREFERALEIAPENVAAHINLAAALAQTGRADEAITHLERAVQLAPENTNALYNLALLRRRRGDAARNDQTEAEARLVRFASDRSERPGRFTVVVATLRTTGRAEAALPRLRSRATAPSASEPVVLEFAECLIATGEFGAAAALLRDAHRRQPEQGLPAALLARVLTYAAR
ncbi:MAG: tetratricopeptide repeat protein [Planctomycetaceae bacterium]